MKTGIVYRRRVMLFVCDMVIMTMSYLLGYWLLVEILSQSLDDWIYTYLYTLPWLLGIRFICGLLVRQYSWSFKQASLAEAFSIVKSTFAGTLLFYLLSRHVQLVPDEFLKIQNQTPDSVHLVEFCVSLMAMGLIRFLPRHFYQEYMRHTVRTDENGDARLRTLIYGAGDTGALILRDILRINTAPYKIVGFVDDDRKKIGTAIQGYRVLGDSMELPVLIGKRKIDKLLIAAPRMSPAKLREIVDVCSNCNVRFKTVPTYSEIVTQGANPAMLKDVKLEHLLDRNPVEFDHTRMAEFFVGRTVLVTGAAGSIGSEICRQAALQAAKRIIAFDMNENDLYFLRMELNEIAPTIEAVLEVGTIRDRGCMDRVFDKYHPHVVFHAAAHKHVPLIEISALQGLSNNVIGTLNVAEAADKAGVESFVMISTDKAVRPSNVMGASKRLAEFVVRDINKNSKTKFMAVRFGNVLGSNGSLIQILERQIEKGGPVTITHPKIKRFFMTIPEAVGLVLVAAVQNEGSLCVLDMGEQLSVDRLARQLITLKGLAPERDIRIVYTGLRPGEKMYEELFTESEQLRPSTNPRIRLAVCDDGGFDRKTMLADLEEILDKGQGVTEFLQKHVPGYVPFSAQAAESGAEKEPAAQA